MAYSDVNASASAGSAAGGVGPDGAQTGSSAGPSNYLVVIDDATGKYLLSFNYSSTQPILVPRYSVGPDGRPVQTLSPSATPSRTPQ